MTISLFIRLLYSEGSFYEGMDIRASTRIGMFEERTNLIHAVVPSQAVTDSIRLPEKETGRNIASFVVIYTMIFFNGCESVRYTTLCLLSEKRLTYHYCIVR